MAKKDGGDIGPALAGLVAGIAAQYAMRKALNFTWARVTGEEPPTDVDSPDISLGRALSWAVMAGVSTEVARVLAVRATRAKLLGAGPEELDV
ncbi:hypothetical protein A6A08_08215 [Nocardiopsis sp. TSRI0078]|uniref:DUF4235 domain-containing protein n=1 Tax=unclassified Nocardiopsis TaxID=2649073 RepID=UPI00093AF96C|nr:DUF4235 domain-containing protein [Nocardiopsis sp. TSRI0078]OKI17273.1 hypothetical protein A6A08_08215 [Nocardiopsis sp. TSRI0078]